MAKKECPSCAMEIDSDANECPICGYEFPKTDNWIKVLVRKVGFRKMQK